MSPRLRLRIEVGLFLCLIDGDAAAWGYQLPSVVVNYTVMETRMVDEDPFARAPSGPLTWVNMMERMDSVGVGSYGGSKYAIDDAPWDEIPTTHSTPSAVHEQHIRLKGRMIIMLVSSFVISILPSAQRYTPASGL